MARHEAFRKMEPNPTSPVLGYDERARFVQQVRTLAKGARAGGIGQTVSGLAKARRRKRY